MSINSQLKDQLWPISKNISQPSGQAAFPSEGLGNGSGGGSQGLKSQTSNGEEGSRSQEGVERSGKEAATTFGASVPPMPSSDHAPPQEAGGGKECIEERNGEAREGLKEGKAGGQAEERAKGDPKAEGRPKARGEGRLPQAPLAIQRLFHKIGEERLPESSGYQRHLQASSARWQEKIRRDLPAVEARWQGRLKEFLALRKDFLGLEEAYGWLGDDAGEREETSRLRKEIEHNLSHILSTIQNLQEIKEALASSDHPLEGSFGSVEGLVFEDASAPAFSLRQAETPTVSVDLAWPSAPLHGGISERSQAFGGEVSPAIEQGRKGEEGRGFVEEGVSAVEEGVSAVGEGASAVEEGASAVEEGASAVEEGRGFVEAKKEGDQREELSAEARHVAALGRLGGSATGEFHPAEVKVFQEIEIAASEGGEKTAVVSGRSQGDGKGAGKGEGGREAVSFERAARAFGGKEGSGEKQGVGKEGEYIPLSSAGGQVYQQEALKASLGERDRGIFEELLYHLHDPGDTLRYLNHAGEEEQYLRLSIWGAKARWLQDSLNGGMGDHPSVRMMFGILLNKKRDLKCRWIDPLDRKFEAEWPKYILEKERELQGLKESMRRVLDRDMEELEKTRVRKVRFFEKVDRLKGLVAEISPGMGEGEAKAKEFLGLLLEIVEGAETGGDLANLDLLMTVRPYEGWFEKGREFRGLRKHLRNLQERAKRHEEVRRASLTELPAAGQGGGEEEGETIQDELLSRVLEHVAGLPALIVGGNEREEKRLRLEKRLQLSSLEWIPSENGRPRACGTAIERIEKGQVKLLLILLSFCGHVKVNQMITAAKKAGIIWVPIAHGHGESRVLHSIAYYLGLLKDAPKGTVWE